MKKSHLLSLALGASLLVAQAQAVWTPLVHQPTSFNASVSFLLMDGRVIVNEVDNSGFSTVRWWTLTPDANGSYVNGTWARVGDAKWTHLYTGSGIFSDGRLIICGGEYSTGGSETNKTEIFDPLTNTWTEIAGPTGWANVGDAPSVILQDGRFFIGSIFDSRSAIYNPVTSSWSAAANTLNSQQTEETYTLLPDNTVLKWNCVGHPGSQRYNPASNSWINCGNTSTVDLVLPGSLETGPGILLPDGRTFAVGGTPKTALYTFPAVVTDPGTWVAGPTPPNINGSTIGAEDAPAALLPNGNVLMALGPVTANGGTFSTPTYYFEFNGTTLTQVPSPPNNGGPPYVSHLLNLPTGEILETAGVATCYIYANGGGPQPAWKPVISAVSSILEQGFSYTLTGKQLTGVTGGSSYGDEANSATNYPIVRLTNPISGAVFYLRAFNPSTRGVQTGNATVSTNFAVGNGITGGAYQMQVIASGMASDPTNVIVPNSFRVSVFSVVRGQLISGGIAELGSSDDQYLIVNRFLVLNGFEAPIQVVFQATSSVINPLFLGLSLEDSVNTVGLSRTIQFLNVQTNTYEDIDTRAANTSDTTTVVNASGNLARFVNQGNGLVTVKTSYFQTGVTALNVWQVKFDRVAVLGY